MHKFLVIAAAVLLSAPAQAAAQQQQTVTASITIPQLLYIDISSPTISFAVPTEADFNTGSIAALELTTVMYRGNVPHSVVLTAESPTFNGGSNTKVAEDLLWSIDGSTWTGLSTSAAKLVAGAPQGQDQKVVSYALKLDYAKDQPATYTIAFTYSIVAD